MQRDYYGNFFYYNYGRGNNPNVPEPITTGEILKLRPSEPWLELVNESLQPEFAVVTAKLLLKVGSEADAFPHIEKLAPTHADLATELVAEFLRVWAQNHDPNDEQSRTNSYMYFYGFEQRANAIPLTRSKQERNLKELGEWVRRLQSLPLETIDEELLTNAFTKAHSSAEVYRLETIENVFGSLSELEPKTLAALVQRMRSNLIGVWREPASQRDKKTNRRQKDIQSEILRGYEVASEVAAKGLVDHPKEWSLRTALAATQHDENNYRAELEKSAEFSNRRREALSEFSTRM